MGLGLGGSSFSGLRVRVYLQFLGVCAFGSSVSGLKSSVSVLATTSAKYRFHCVMKNLTDFRKTVETGVDPRLIRLIRPSTAHVASNIWETEWLLLRKCSETGFGCNYRKG